MSSMRCCESYASLCYYAADVAGTVCEHTLTLYTMRAHNTLQLCMYAAQSCRRGVPGERGAAAVHSVSTAALA
jgi:hypothetical protein